MGEGVSTFLFRSRFPRFPWRPSVSRLLDLLVHALSPFDQQPTTIWGVRSRRPLRRGVRCRRPLALARGLHHPRPGGPGSRLFLRLLLLGRVQILLKQNCSGVNSEVMQGFYRGPQTLGTYGLSNQEAACRVKPAPSLSCPALATNAACSDTFFLAGAMSISSL